jgi:hypothetical protein
MFLGNRGCLVDDDRRMVRHHLGQLWIICVLSYKDWKSPLDKPRHWTPLFFLDDAVALAAGHRPCGLCRHHDHLAYREGVRVGLGLERFPSATDLNRMLAKERLSRGRGMSRSGDRILWDAQLPDLPDGTVIVEEAQPLLVTGGQLLQFSWDGWLDTGTEVTRRQAKVLTPPTSVLALSHGYRPVLHPTATRR